MGEVPAAQAWGLNSSLRSNVRKPEVVVHACKPRGKETETGQCLELAEQLLDNLVSPRAVRSPVPIKKIIKIGGGF